jgi:hypothetical protein
VCEAHRRRWLKAKDRKFQEGIDAMQLFKDNCSFGATAQTRALPDACVHFFDSVQYEK